MDVTTWLRGLGLERYAPAFRDNDVDDEVLPALTSDDLISIGVTSVGHRRKLLDAIAGLREIPTAAVTAAFRDDLELAAGTGERRQLTVMFCDVVGSTAIVSTPRSGGSEWADPQLSSLCRHNNRALQRLCRPLRR